MKYLLTASLLAFCLSGALIGQSNSDDYWLNNGFTSGETIYTNSGYFYDDGGNSQYQEGQDWTVTFCSENSNPLTLDFADFATHFGGTIGDDTYDDYDYMTVRFSGYEYYVYHDDTPEFSITSQDQCITVEFHSDNDGQIHEGWKAEIYALPPPDNNDPADAEELIVGNTCSPSFYTNKGAYSTTNLGSPPCKEYFGGDVWFSLVVPASGEVKIETFAGSLTYAILDIYQSDDSNITDGERIACIDDAGVMPSVTLSGPTVSAGETIYIRVFGEQAKSGLFGICARDPSSPVTGYTGPGGVGDDTSMDFWYKIDSGVMNALGNEAVNNDMVATWEDQSGNGNDLLQAGSALQPSYVTGIENGFGALQFDGSDLMEAETGSGDAPMHWYAVGEFLSTGSQTMLSLGDEQLSKTASISIYSDDRYYCNNDGALYGPSLSRDQYYIFHASHMNGNPYHYLELNGQDQTVDAASSALETDGSLQLGDSWDETEAFNGRISELFQYKSELNTAQENIVANYLASKFNLSIGSIDFYDYKTSYYYDLAGIGRVDVSNMHTKAQSAGVLSVGGADDLGDNEYLFVGHDNADFSTWNSANVPSGDSNVVRLDRVWRASLEGDPGTISISFDQSMLPALPADFVAYNILVDADGDFSSGAITYSPFEIDGELVINDVSISHGDHLAVAAIRPVVSFVTANTSSLEDVVNPNIEVVLNYPVSSVVQVDYLVSSSTAVQGEDFSLLPFSISINPGDNSGYITPLIIEDTIAEIPDEYFDVQISTSTAGVIAAGITTCRHTILNNDVNVSIIPEDTIIGECVTSSTQLVAVPVGTGPFTYSWTPLSGLSSTDNDTVQANPSVTTVYTLEVSDASGNTGTAEIEIEVVPLPGKPAISLSGASEFCAGDSLRLNAPLGYEQYLWSGTAMADSVWVYTSGTYNVIVVDSFGCSSIVSDDVSFTAHALPPKPLVTSSGANMFCDGDSVILSAPDSYDSYFWSEGSTNDSLIVYTSGSYNVSVTDANGCASPFSDDVAITVNPRPAKQTILVSDSDEFCEGDSALLSLADSFDEYLWSTGSTESSIYVSTSGDYNVSVKNSFGCESDVSDDVSITVHATPAAPTITPSGSLSFCDGGSVTLSPSGSFSSYLWTDGNTTQDRDIDYSGEFAVRYTDGNGCDSHYSDSVEVVVHSLPVKPVLVSTGLTEFCDGDSLILKAPEAFDAYTWSDATNNDSLIVYGSGVYNVSVRDANGCDSPLSDDVTVTVHAVPAKQTILATGGDELCAGDSVLLSLGDSFAEYLWSTGSTESSIYVSSDGSYNVSVKNEFGCESEVSDDISITLHATPDAPVITSSGSLEFCEGGSVNLHPSGDYATYVWSDGTAIKARDIDYSGEFAVRFTDENGCESYYSDSIEVIVHELPAKPAPTIVGALEFCEGDSALLVGPAAYASYEWSDGSTNDTISVFNNASLSLHVIDENTCVSPESDLITLTMNANPAAPVIGADGPIAFCDGGTVTLDAGASYSGYYWSTGEETSSILVASSGAYKLVIEDAKGCFSDSSDALNVEAYDLPDQPLITADGPLVFITGDSVVLSASLSTAYEWFPDGETSQTITVKESGDFSVRVKNENSCESLVSEIVSVIVGDYLPAVDITVDGDLEFCDGGLVGLSGPDGYNEYVWSNGMSGQQIEVTESGSITLIARISSGVETIPSDEVLVTVYDNPVLELATLVEPLCNGENTGSIEVSVSGGLAPYEIAWDGYEESGVQLNDAEAGDYNVNVSDANACEATLSVTLDEPEAISVEEDISAAYCPDFSDGSISLDISGGIAPYLVSWDDVGGSEYINDLAPGSYAYQISDANNCSFESSVIVSYLNEVCFEIPEIITPNGDSYNDFWQIDGLEVYENVVIQVFDRWGKRVFYSEGHDVYFDGTYDGKDLPMESYHYVINLNNGSEAIIGNITIVR